MNVSRMSNDHLRMSAEACQRVMQRSPRTAVSYRTAERNFNAYRAELARRAATGPSGHWRLV